MMNNRGVTLTEVMVGLAILTTMALAAITISLFNNDTADVASRSDGARRLNSSTGEVLRDSGFAILLSECDRIGASAEQLQPATCTTADDKFNPSPTGGTPLFPLRKRVDSFGTPNVEGDFCTEILQCRLLAGGRVLEVHIATYWADRAASMAGRGLPHLIRVAR